MKNKLVNYFSSITPLSREEAEGIAESMQVRSYEKGEYLLREGHIAMSSYFILEGEAKIEKNIANEGDFIIISNCNDLSFSVNSMTKIFEIKSPLRPSYATYSERFMN